MLTASAVSVPTASTMASIFSAAPLTALRMREKERPVVSTAIMPSDTLLRASSIVAVACCISVLMEAI
ncbi:hypothetical protein D3C79_1017940 [compost metagenome]